MREWEEMLAELESLINDIQPLYDKVTCEWQNRAASSLHLKKTLVSDIDLDGTVYQSVMEYIRLLNERSAGIALRLSSVCRSQVTARVKAQNSIEFKIQNYKTERHEWGKVPLNKCLNDLFGVRIILDSPLTFEQIRAHIDEVYHGKLRCIDSSKGEYKAVHIYFRADNRSFPWELQIWDRCDAQGNFASHKKYKQTYTTWEKESKEGGIING